MLYENDVYSTVNSCKYVMLSSRLSYPFEIHIVFSDAPLICLSDRAKSTIGLVSLHVAYPKTNKGEHVLQQIMWDGLMPLIFAGLDSSGIRYSRHFLEL